MKKTVRIIIAFVVLAALIAGVLYAVSRQRAAAAESALDQVVSAAVERGRIDAVVVATGSLAPERTQALTFATAGTVEDVLIENGAIVAKDQLLATLDDATLQLNLSSSRASLASAEAQLARVSKGPSEASIAAAEASVAAAQSALWALYAGPTDEQIRVAELQIDQAKNSLWAAQANRDSVAGNPMAPSSSVDQAEAQVLNAEVGVQLAQAKYDQLFVDPSTTMVRNAQLQVAQAEANLNTLTSSPSAEDIAAAQAAVDQAGIGVQLVERQLENLELTAPFAGYIEGWNLTVGDMVSPSMPLATLVDDTDYHIDVYIDETEIGQVSAGQSAVIVVDSFPDDEIEGTVKSIDLLGQSALGIVTYRVRIALANTELELRPQLTSSVEIVTASAEDVLLISNRALRRDELGKYVEVQNGFKFEKRYLETGLVGDNHTEILSGLEAGDEYVVSRPADAGSDVSLPFGGF